jgi:SagB-type dehydrogenase family enzyme
MSTIATEAGMPHGPAINSAAGTIRAYHQRTKHRADGYARGPETLDWDAQPDPWRHWEGCARVALPLVSDTLHCPYAVLTGEVQVDPAPLGLEAVAALLELSFGLSAWKEAGSDRWAMRCNPSSGNLHPTEVYVLASGVPGLANGVHHYDSRAHALDRRCATDFTDGGLWIGLSSIPWREAWKYGERAFRYCQLDIGHALGALRATAAVLGWRVTVVGMDHAGIAELLGTDRLADFAGVEREEAELVLAIEPWPARSAGAAPPVRIDTPQWHGQPSLLDPHPMVRWPVIDEVAIASRNTATSGNERRATIIDLPIPSLPAPEACAVATILGRRSAQRYDRAHVMPLATLARILNAVRPHAASGFHLIAYVHAVERLDRGIYALARPGAEAALRTALDPDFAWSSVAGFPADTPLRQLASGDCRKLVRALTCHQAIAADGCVTFSLLSDFATLIDNDAAAYRTQHWQAGLLGHALYLEAQAIGLAGTGIGCFLDDEIHRMLGLRDDGIQALFHFTVGKALADPRIATAPAYGARSRDEAHVRE